MNSFILTDTTKDMHWVVKMLDPDTLALPKGGGEVTMRVQVAGFCKTMKAAEKREIEIR